MRVSIWVGLLFLATILVLGGCKKGKDTYKDLPKELAELSRQIDKHPKKSELYYQRNTTMLLDLSKKVSRMLPQQLNWMKKP